MGSTVRVKLVKNSEGLLRVLSFVLAIVTALVIGLDKQTKTVFFMERKSTVKVLQALWVATIIASVASGYHLLQLFRCGIFACLGKNNPCKSNKFFAWTCFILDQGATYAVFAGTMAAMQASLVAVFGIDAMQWGKVCNIYTRFCVEIGSGLACGVLTSIAMAVVSSLSAYHLFSLYPSTGRSRSPDDHRVVAAQKSSH